MRSTKYQGSLAYYPLQNRVLVAALVILTILNLCTATVLADESYRVVKLEIFVYRDGVAHVRSTLAANSTISSISLLISRDAANIVVTDENRRLVRHELTNDTILIYTFGVSRLELEYDTAALTRKDGSVWTLRLNLPLQGKVLLPDGAAIVYFSGRPASIEAEDGRPSLTLEHGVWEISYVLSFQTTKTASTTTVSTLPGSVISPPFLAVVGLIGVAAIVSLIGLPAVLRRRRISSEILSPADNEMLQAIRSRGGKIFESELRDSLGLPKTSAWRRVKKLEKMGLVKIRRVGSLNEIELS